MSDRAKVSDQACDLRDEIRELVDDSFTQYGSENNMWLAPVFTHLSQIFLQILLGAALAVMGVGLGYWLAGIF